MNTKQRILTGLYAIVAVSAPLAAISIDASQRVAHAPVDVLSTFTDMFPEDRGSAFSSFQACRNKDWQGAKCRDISDTYTPERTDNVSPQTQVQKPYVKTLSRELKTFQPISHRSKKTRECSLHRLAMGGSSEAPFVSFCRGGNL